MKHKKQVKKEPSVSCSSTITGDVSTCLSSSLREREDNDVVDEGDDQISLGIKALCKVRKVMAGSLKPF